jgi:phosphatidylinositol alpha-1,6-mannosyltransferase
MKVLMFLHDAYGSQGGISRNNRDVLDALVNDPRVTRVDAVPRIAGAGGEVIPAKVEWRSRAAAGAGAYLAESLRAMASGRFDLVLAAHIRLLPAAYLAKLATGAPLWLFIYGIDAWEAPANPLLTRLTRRADRVISISEVTTARFQAWARMPKDRLRLLPCTVDLDRFRPGAPDPALQARYGLAGKRVLFTFGRLVSAERAKGMDEVMEAMPALLSEYPDLVYLIGGDGPDRPRLEAKARALGLGPHVIFAGRIAEAEKVAHYRLADAYVMPSRGEGMGIVILEAMAAGVPALASVKDGSREAVLDGKLGILVDPDDRTSVSDGIRRVLARPRGRPEGLDYFSVASFRQRMSALLDELPADGAARS